jgi:DNA-binding SARP family transcriptional activator/tetratricopeptide (TPR) repeat protein
LDIEIRLLGPFEVRRDGRPVIVSSERLRALLAVLAMSVREFVSMDTIGSALWGDEPPDSIRRAVQTYVARLRRMFGDELIATAPGGYLLDVDPECVDAHRFLRLTTPPGSPEQLTEALKLWRGVPFDGIRSGWLAEAETPRLLERYLNALEQRVDLDIAADRPAGTGAGELAAELRELTTRYPLRESLWARLLVVLDRAGRQAEALECYETIRARLAGELGVDPGPELQQIHASLVNPSGMPSSVPRQLPSDADLFTGRTTALAALDRLLPAAQPTRPIVIAAIHGAGGTGKTALAVHWAHRVRDHFPDGQIFVNLRGYGPGEPMTPAAALDVILRSLDVPGDQIPTGVDARTAMLRSKLADRRMLILLDNARDAAQVRPLLPGSASLVVVTSRNQLRGLVVRDGAHRVGLGQLDPAESLALLTEALPAGHPEELLAELATLCGHLPLALRIAAEYVARYPETGPAELIAQLRSEPARLEALDVTDDPAASLVAVFSWSYRALEPGTARMFRLLGLHPGPDIGLAGAAALAGTTPRQARALLDRLTEAHLVEQRHPGRWHQHDLLRVYAAGQTTEPERTAALDRLHGWYLHSAANARRGLRRGVPLTGIGEPPADTRPAEFGDPAEARAWFEAERDNLAALIRYAAAQGRHRAAYGITQMLWVHLSHAYLLDDVFELHGLAIDAARAAGDLTALATSHSQLGTTCGRLGDNRRARWYFEQAFAHFEAAGNEPGQASALGNLGAVFQATGRFAEAQQRQERGLAIARRMDDPASLVHLLNNLAMTYVGLRRYDDAVAACQEAIDLQQTHDIGSEVAHQWDTMGLALTGRGDHARAVEAFRRALQGFREVEDRWNEALVLSHLGTTQRAAGTIAEARASWQQAVQILDDIGATDNEELSRPALLALLSSVAAAY